MKIISIIIFFSVICTGLLLLHNNNISNANSKMEEFKKMERTIISIPKWRKGSWWIVETHIVMDVSEIDDGIERLGDIIFHHKYEIIGQKKMNGKDIWIVDIKAINVPADIKNDHGDNYLWRMYIDKETFTLKKLDISIRGQKYLVSGKNVISRSFDFHNENPVVIQGIVLLTPLDIPRLPQDKLYLPPLEEEKNYVYTDELTKKEILQHYEVIREKNGENTINSIYISLIGDAIGTRTQKWIPGVPWWTEWRCTKNDGTINGLWYAKTIEYENKGE